MGVVARHLTIQGRVQGVFYRKWMAQAALVLGVTGWVRNRMDGSVEAVVEGDASAVERFMARAHDGPLAAKVARIACRTIDVQGFETFVTKPTA